MFGNKQALWFRMRLEKFQITWFAFKVRVAIAFLAEVINNKAGNNTYNKFRIQKTVIS